MTAHTLSRAGTVASAVASITDLIRHFQSTPYAFLYEADLQSVLHASLRSMIPGHATVQRLDQDRKPSGSYEISTVYSEYKSRIDLVCLDPEELEHITEPQLRQHRGSNIYLYELPVLVGIEIKYRKLGDIFGIDSCIRDFEKLSGLRVPVAVIIGFIQDDSDSTDFFATKGEWNVSLCDRLTIESFHESIVVVSPKYIWQCQIAKNTIQNGVTGG